MPAAVVPVPVPVRADRLQEPGAGTGTGAGAGAGTGASAATGAGSGAGPGSGGPGASGTAGATSAGQGGTVAAIRPRVPLSQRWSRSRPSSRPQQFRPLVLGRCLAPMSWERPRRLRMRGPESHLPNHIRCATRPSLRPRSSPRRGSCGADVRAANEDLRASTRL
jgi:hypothetical protein